MHYKKGSNMIANSIAGLLLASLILLRIWQFKQLGEREMYFKRNIPGSKIILYSLLFPAIMFIALHTYSKNNIPGIISMPAILVAFIILDILTIRRNGTYKKGFIINSSLIFYSHIRKFEFETNKLALTVIAYRHRKIVVVNDREIRAVLKRKLETRCLPDN